MFVIRCARRVILLVLLAFLPGVMMAATERTGGSLSLGYRVDSLDWNISGESGNPNILSELEWKSMDILQLRGELSGSTDAGIYFRGLANYGGVRDGQNRDSDYAGDNRSLEFSRSGNDVDGSQVMDLSGGLGATLYAAETGQWRIIPMIGYSWHRQDLRMRNGNQVVWDSGNAALLGVGGNVPLGPFAGLNSTYKAVWYGPWLGTDVVWDLQGGSMLFSRLETHWVDYYARANWNLRTVANNPISALQHPVSFEHWADGRGWVLELGWRSPLSRRYWVWGISLTLQRWHTGAGLDRIYGADPASPCNGNCYVETRLNEVNWSSGSIDFTLQKSFAN